MHFLSELINNTVISSSPCCCSDNARAFSILLIYDAFSANGYTHMVKNKITAQNTAMKRLTALGLWTDLGAPLNRRLVIRLTMTITSRNAAQRMSATMLSDPF